MRDPENETLPARDWSELPYVRVYYSVLTDRKFERVYHDDAAFAGYVRLLISADQTWPMPAELPAWVGRRVLKLLVEVGLLIQQGSMYRMSGLDKERQSRFGKSGDSHHSGRQKYPSDDPVTRRGKRSNGALAESTRSNGVVHAESMRNLAGARAHSVSVSSSVVTPEGGPGETDDPYVVVEADALQWLARHGCSMTETSKLRQDLVLIVTKFGTEAVVGKFDRLSRAGVLDGDTSGFIWQARDALFPKADLRALDREERAEEEQGRINRRFQATQREIARTRHDA